MRKVLAIFLLLASGLFSSCHFARMLIWNFPDIRDAKKFPKMEIPKGDNPFVFFAAEKNSPVILPKDTSQEYREYDFEELLKKTKTVAFIVIRNDSILYQQYLNGYSESSVIPSFSMAKSFVSMLAGIAIDEGAIKSIHDPITNYLPELTNPGFEKITIKNLLNMRSGIAFNESPANPFGDVAKYYYGDNLKKYITKLKVAKKAGHTFEYKSVNAQLLAMIVERATHKPLAEYMEEKVWQYIGAEYDASWSIDSRKNKEAKAFCCFNARPLDFAKLGRLYLHKGNWNGRQVVSEKWVKESLDVSTKRNRKMYSYMWWHTNGSNGRDFFAQGLMGQYVYVYPEKNIIIVRLGKKYGIYWLTLLRSIAEAN